MRGGGRAYIAGNMCDGGHVCMGWVGGRLYVWWGCMAEAMCGRWGICGGGMHGRVVCMVGACITGGIHGGGHVWWGHAWQGGVHGGGMLHRGHAWWGTCVAGGMHGIWCA